MGRFDELPADQRATLQLLLTQGKSYAELAGLLRLQPDAVRDRALDALDALGPDTPAGLTGNRQDEISDYLLGQQSVSERAGTRRFLESSGAGRAWAQPVAAELRSIGNADVPDIPAAPAEVDEAFGALSERRRTAAGDERTSRLGGILLLAATGIAVAVLLVVLLKPGGDDDKSSSSSDSALSSGGADTTAAGDDGASTGTGGTTGAGGQAQPEQQFNMLGKNGYKSQAIAIVLKGADGHRILGVQGAKFAPFKDKGFYYAVWLTGGSGGPARLGFVSTDVPASGSKKGQLVTGADPSSVTDAKTKALLRKQIDGIYGYKQIEITRETAQNPTTPGTVVVSGAIRRPSGAGG